MPNKKKIYILNGSPRKNWNTAKMCESFANGAESKGVEVEIVNLYDIDFKGCRSCFSCKLRGGKNFSRCSYSDDLTPLLDKISNSDGAVFASPIYFGDITGVMRTFSERLMFPFFQYEKGYPSTAPKKFPTAVIYTMNVPEGLSNQMYREMMGRFEWFIEICFSKPIRVGAFDTCQFDDYSKYAAKCFDAEHKTMQLKESLPRDLEKAYNAGVKMAERVVRRSRS